MVRSAAVKIQLNARVTVLDLSLIQKVRLWNSQAYSFARTWRRHSAIAVSPEIHAEQVREMAGDAISRFVNDWQKADPKQ